MKKEKKVIMIILVVILLIALFSYVFGKKIFISENVIENKSISGFLDNNTERDYCDSNNDCVPASCCHPKSCVVKSSAPKCGRIFCTQECAPNSMDCGQGSCACQENKCVTVFN